MIRTLKYIVGLIVLVPLLIVLALVAANLYDPPLDPRIIEIEAKYPLPADSENAYLGLKQLDALQANAAESQKSLQDDVASLRCLYNIGFTSYNDSEAAPCASDEAAASILEKHRPLLDRYKSMSSYPRFADYPAGMDSAEPTPSYGSLVELQKLAVADMVLKSRTGRAEDAISFWIDNVRFLNNGIADQTAIVTQAILFICQEASLKTLPVILEAQPDLAGRYAAQLLPLLSTPAFGAGGVDLEKVFLAEKRVVQNVNPAALVGDTSTESGILHDLSYKKNHTTNKVYDHLERLKNVVENPVSAFDKSHTSISAENDPIQNSLILAMLYNPVGNMLLSGFFKGQELYGANHWNRIARMRLLGAYVQALSENVSPENMPAFLSGKPEWKNPVSGEAFSWDPQTSEIYFEQQAEGSNPVKRYGIRYIQSVPAPLPNVLYP